MLQYNIIEMWNLLMIASEKTIFNTKGNLSTVS